MKRGTKGWRFSITSWCINCCPATHQSPKWQGTTTPWGGDSQIKKSISLQNRCIYLVCIKISCIITKMLICLEQNLFPKTSKPLCPTVFHISAPWGFDDVQQDGPLNGIGDKIPENKSPPVRFLGLSWFRNRHPKKHGTKKKRWKTIKKNSSFASWIVRGQKIRGTEPTRPKDP